MTARYANCVDANVIYADGIASQYDVGRYARSIAGLRYALGILGRSARGYQPHCAWRLTVAGVHRNFFSIFKTALYSEVGLWPA